MVFSIIQKSQLEKSLRIDAEFYEPKHLEMQHLLEASKYATLQEVSEKIINFGAYSLNNFIEYLDNGVPYLFVGDIRDNYIDLSDVKYIDESLSKGLLHKSIVTNGQVLLTIAGTIGNASVATGLPQNTNSNQAIANIYPKKFINPYYLSTFLNCKYGKMQSQRYVISNVQPNLLLTQVKKMLIPLVDEQKQEGIAKIVKEALFKREESEKNYKQAENLLLEELGLTDFEIPDDLAYEVNFSEVKNANRMDADYFQPKYEKLFKVSKTPLYRLAEITTFLNHGKQPPYTEESGVPIITQRHLGLYSPDIATLSDEDTRQTTSEWCEHNKKYKLKRGDLLYYSVGAYIGKTNVILEDIATIVPAGFLTLIRVNEKLINPVYLTIVFNSIVGQLQSEKWQSATAQSYIYPKDIRNFKIPVVSMEIQERITDLVKKSYEARKKSKKLFEEAKREVEEMIETNLPVSL